jgi:hypothetical protein
MMTRLDRELLAKEFAACRIDVQGLGEFLTDVADFARTKHGFDPSAHPNGNCAFCGGYNGRDHNGAKYCSSRCRQRAYRARLGKGSSPDAFKAKQAAKLKRELRLMRRIEAMNRNKTAVRDVSSSAEDKQP